MSRLSFVRVCQPRYLVPVAGWAGCVFLLKFMMTGMAGHGLVQPGMDSGGAFAALERSDAVGDGAVQTAAADPAPAPARVERVEKAEVGLLDAELAEQRASGAPI